VEETMDIVDEIRSTEETRPEGGGGYGGGRGRGGYVRKPRVCQFCIEKVKIIDYKQADMLRKFVMERGKIRPRRQTGTCALHQRALAAAVKRARHLALLPFADD
jgi:small subunit ribosomal protein S18